MALTCTLDDLLRLMPEKEASDLHVRAGEPPIFRIHGDLTRLTEFPVLTPDDAQALMYPIMNEAHRQRYEEVWEMDMAYEIEGVARYRVNCFRQRNALGAVLRMIPIEIKTIDDLGLPQTLKQLALLPRGLVLVTGPTGSGKSTTLAAMVDHINERVACHIVTIEDPIEFLHSDKVSSLNQREVGSDTHSFSDALKRVVRADPDVILVGEMRDLETIHLAITAAETGHLVFATLHTTDAMQTVDRAVDVFPPEMQQQIRMQLSVTLQGVVCQQLLHRRGGGRVPSFEIMVGSPAIAALIREGKTHMLYNMIQSSAEMGMIALDQYLVNLVRAGYVEYEEALSKSSNPKEFATRMGQKFDLAAPAREQPAPTGEAAPEAAAAPPPAQAQPAYAQAVPTPAQYAQPAPQQYAQPAQPAQLAYAQPAPAQYAQPAPPAQHAQPAPQAYPAAAQPQAPGYPPPPPAPQPGGAAPTQEGAPPPPPPAS